MSIRFMWVAKRFEQLVSVKKSLTE